jgi:hypothetical protein
VITIFRVEGIVTLQPSMALGNDHFRIWVRRQRLHLMQKKSNSQNFIVVVRWKSDGAGVRKRGEEGHLVSRESNEPFDE